MSEATLQSPQTQEQQAQVVEQLEQVQHHPASEQLPDLQRDHEGNHHDHSIELKDGHVCSADCPEHSPPDHHEHAPHDHTIETKHQKHACSADCPEHGSHDHSETHEHNHHDRGIEHKDHACSADCPEHSTRDHHEHDHHKEHSIEQKHHDHACGPDCPEHSTNRHSRAKAETHLLASREDAYVQIQQHLHRIAEQKKQETPIKEPEKTKISKPEEAVVQVDFIAEVLVTESAPAQPSSNIIEDVQPIDVTKESDEPTVQPEILLVSAEPETNTELEPIVPQVIDVEANAIALEVHETETAVEFTESITSDDTFEQPMTINKDPAPIELLDDSIEIPQIQEDIVETLAETIPARMETFITPLESQEAAPEQRRAVEQAIKKLGTYELQSDSSPETQQKIRQDLTELLQQLGFSDTEATLQMYVRRYGRHFLPVLLSQLTTMLQPAGAFETLTQNARQYAQPAQRPSIGSFILSLITILRQSPQPAQQTQ